MGNSGFYFPHYIRRLQDNNYDCLMVVSGDKGFGKSTIAMLLARAYNSMFSFVCPHCGNEFYKNPFVQITHDDGSTEFKLHPKIKSVECPKYFELNIKTNEKILKSGCGKSHPYSQRKRIKWDAAKFIAYDNNDVIKKIHTMPQFSPLICDEAIKFAAAMNHMKAESKELKELFTVIRPKRLFVMFCVPDFSWIDSKYREGMSSFWIRCIERGTAVIFEKDKAEGKDHYHLDELKQIMGTVKFFTPMEKIKRNIKKHPCYFDMIRFGELPPKIYENYEYVRNARNLQLKVEEMELTNKDVAKIMAFNLWHHWDRIMIRINQTRERKMTYDIMADEVSINPFNRKPLASDMTLRNWVKGVEQYVESKGEKADFVDDIQERTMPDIDIEL